MNSKKTAKVSADMAKVISEILFMEAEDELLKTVTITGCKVSSDLCYAKVYFTSLSDIDHNAMEKEVNEAASFIRFKVAEILNLRRTPELTFIYDDSIENAQKIEEIINEIHNEK